MSEKHGRGVEGQSMGFSVEPTYIDVLRKKPVRATLKGSLLPLLGK